MKCPNCKFENFENKENMTCTKCGHPLAMAKFLQISYQKIVLILAIIYAILGVFVFSINLFLK